MTRSDNVTLPTTGALLRTAEARGETRAFLMNEVSRGASFAGATDARRV